MGCIHFVHCLTLLELILLKSCNKTILLLIGLTKRCDFSALSEGGFSLAIKTGGEIIEVLADGSSGGF